MCGCDGCSCGGDIALGVHVGVMVCVDVMGVHVGVMG